MRNTTVNYTANNSAISDMCSCREIISKDGISCSCFNSNGQMFVVGDGGGSVYICGEPESEQLAATLV